MVSHPDGPRLRPALDGIPVYVPGRSDTPYKLSSNENPYPPLPSVLAMLAESATRMNRYPDLACEELVAALAGRLNVPSAHIAAGTGAVALLQQFVQSVAGPGDEVLYAWRSFEIYPIFVQVAGAASVRVPLRDERHDLEAMADALTERTRLVIVCNPNNPTSTTVGRAEMNRFLDRVPEDVLVLLDEAYIEFARDPELPDGLALYRERPNVAVLRTFSKAYGLAGLRVGYAVAREEIADALRKTAVPFGVNRLAQDAAVASLRAQDELLERCELLVKERERVVGALRDQGWDVPSCEANFVWLRLGEQTVPFAAACERAGVMVRPYAGEGVRVTVGEAPANELFLAVAADHARRVF